MAKPGEIIWAAVRDKNGHLKDRPLVVLAVHHRMLTCCAITTQDITPRPGYYFRMPWDSEGRSQTGLRRPCYAVANWIEEIKEGDVRKTCGSLPMKQLAKLLDLVA